SGRGRYHARSALACSVRSEPPMRRTPPIGMHRHENWTIVLLAGACHSNPGGGEEPAADGTGSETTAAGGSDTGDTEPDACAGEAMIGRAPLRRLARAQLRNAIADLVGVDVDVDGLPSDEKLGPFDANSIAPVSEVAVEDYAEIAATASAQLTSEQLQA